MAKATRRYSAKLKFQVVLEALKGEKSPAQIAKAYQGVEGSNAATPGGASATRAPTPVPTPAHRRAPVECRRADTALRNPGRPAGVPAW